MHDILAEVLTPHDATRIFNFWLFVLTEANINITSYLAREQYLYQMYRPVFINEVAGRPRCITVAIDQRSQPHFSWDWWVDPRSPALDVLVEFKNFGPFDFDLTLQMEIILSWESKVPSYYFPILAMNDLAMNPQVYEDEILAKLVSQPRLWDMRGQRRRQRKADMLSKKRFQVPGSWVD